jgi:hypothetical protein
VELFLEFPPERPVGEVQEVIAHLQRSIREEVLGRTDVTVVATRTAPAEM